jgi:hypothetical protein
VAQILVLLTSSITTQQRQSTHTAKQLQILHRDADNAPFAVRFKSEQFAYDLAYTGLHK